MRLPAALFMLIVLLLPQGGGEFQDYHPDTLLWEENGGEAVSWSPDGRYIVSQMSSQQSMHFSFKYWVVDEWYFYEVRTQHKGIIRVFEWSPDGGCLATAFRDLFIFQTGAWIMRHNITLDTSIVRSMDWSPDGRYLAAGTETGKVFIVDAETWEVVDSFKAHELWTSALAWSPDSRHLASGGRDGKVKIWSAQDWSLERTISAHSNEVSTLAWGKQHSLVSGGFDGAVVLWDPATGRKVKKLGSFPEGGAVFDVQWNTKYGMLLSSGSQGIMIFSTDNWTLLQVIGTVDGKPLTDVFHVSWEGGGRRFASCTREHLYVWKQGARAEKPGEPPYMLYILTALTVAVIASAGVLYARKSRRRSERHGRHKL